MAPCETWDNAILACEVKTDDQHFPMLISTKRIAPGEGNTWFIKVHGTEFSAEFSTKYPKTLRTMTYRSGKPQSWETLDIGYASAYPTITGGYLRVRLFRQHPADGRRRSAMSWSTAPQGCASRSAARRRRRRTPITGC